MGSSEDSGAALRLSSILRKVARRKIILTGDKNPMPMEHNGRLIWTRQPAGEKA